MVPSPCAFTRLHLHLLQPEHIKMVLANTRLTVDGRQTLRSRWRLDSEEKLTVAAKMLFKRSAGHPRTLYELLVRRETYESLLEAKQHKFDHEAWKKLLRELYRYRQLLRKWLVEGEVVDLTEKIEDPGNMQVSIAQILGRCHLAWEGTKDKATVYALPAIEHEVLGVVFPFTDYIKHVADSARFVSPDHADVWEWSCLKSFQQIFSKKCVPNEKRPTFFAENTLFGSLEGVHFSPDVRFLPKITTKTKIRSPDAGPLIEADTVNPKDWPRVLQEVNTAVDMTRAGSLCFKFRPKSKSPDVLLMARLKTAGYESMLMVGLAVKNYGEGTQFGDTNIRKEIAKFADLLPAAGGEQINILFVCSTNYSPTLMRRFGPSGAFSYPVPPGLTNLHAVIVLNLATSSMRAEFCGTSGYTKFIAALDKVIDKVVPEMNVLQCSLQILDV